MTLTHFLRILPPKTTSQQKRVNMATGRFYKTGAGMSAEALYLQALLPIAPEKPLDGPVRLEVMVVWPYLKSDVARKADRERKDWIAHTGKPDLDNWVKQFQDCLVKARFIARDECVYFIGVSKHRGPDHEVGVSFTLGMKEIGRRAQHEDTGYLAAELGITKRYVYMIQAEHLKRQAEGGVE